MPASNERRIAIFGTFDVENYGDLLFPLLAQQRLAPEGMDLVAVSPTAGVTRYRDTVPVISLAEFAKTANSFDGILIGGGNIVHIRDFGLPGYDENAYPALWAGATAHALRHGLPVAWNAPGVLAPKGQRPARTGCSASQQPPTDLPCGTHKAPMRWTAGPAVARR
jgi:hypothetical protein